MDAGKFELSPDERTRDANKYSPDPKDPSGWCLAFPYLIRTLALAWRPAELPLSGVRPTATSFFCRSCVMYRVQESDGALCNGSQAIVPTREGRASKLKMEDSLLRRWRVLCGFAAMVPIRCINISSSGWTTADRPAWKRKLSSHSSTHTQSSNSAPTHGRSSSCIWRPETVTRHCEVASS